MPNGSHWAVTAFHRGSTARSRRDMYQRQPTAAQAQKLQTVKSKAEKRGWTFVDSQLNENGRITATFHETTLGSVSRGGVRVSAPTYYEKESVIRHQYDILSDGKLTNASHKTVSERETGRKWKLNDSTGELTEIKRRKK